MSPSPRSAVARFCFLLAWLTAVLGLPVCSFSSAYDGHPKLVVVIVIDQFRGDYLERYRAEFGDAGFRFLLDRAPTSPTVTTITPTRAPPLDTPLCSPAPTATATALSPTNGGTRRKKPQ